MSVKDLFFVSQIAKDVAQDIVKRNHYLHRQAPCSLAFGLFCKETKRIVGVIMYGVSCSSTLLRGICGDDESKNVYELTRLWIEDGTPKNSESFLIGQSIKQLDKEIIVSFAEKDVGHVGTIYQATNFLYCGLSAKFKDPKVKGLEHQHHATFAHGMTIQQVKQKYGEENVTYVDRPRKHRYVYFSCSMKRRKELLKKLKYSILPYPKLTKSA